MMNKRRIIKKLESVSNEEIYFKEMPKDTEMYWEGIRDALCLVLEEKDCKTTYKLHWEK